MYTPMGQKLWQFAEEAQRADSLDRLSTLFQALVEPYGVKASSVAFLGTGENLMAPGFGKPPKDWGERYVASNHAENDPILQSIRVRGTVGLWSNHLAGLRLRSEEKTVMGEAAEFGWKDGFNKIYMPEKATPLLLNLIGEKLDHSKDALRLFDMAGYVMIEEAYKFVVRETGYTGYLELTERQREILDLLSHGWPQREIASELGISHRTVETHVANIKDRLGVKTSGEAIRMATTRGPDGLPDGDAR